LLVVLCCHWPTFFPSWCRAALSWLKTSLRKFCFEIIKICELVVRIIQRAPLCPD
jgi:hypothetical protein